MFVRLFECMCGVWVCMVPNLTNYKLLLWNFRRKYRSLPGKQEIFLYQRVSLALILARFFVQSSLYFFLFFFFFNLWEYK